MKNGIDTEMIERIAREVFGPSYPNEYAKKYAVDKVVKILFALNKEDVDKIIKEIENRS